MTVELSVVAQATSFDSAQDAIDRALASVPEPGGIEFYSVSITVERGGFVGRVQYHAALTRTATLPEPAPEE